MNRLSYRHALGLAGCAVLAFAAVAASAREIAVVNVVANRATCVYARGEEAELTVSVNGTNGTRLVAGRVSVTVDNFGARKEEVRTVDLSAENPFTMRMSRKEPGFLRMTVRSADKALSVRDYRGDLTGSYVFGVAFAPREIEPGTPNPEDFDEFWARSIRELDEKVPVDAKMELAADLSTAAANVYRVSFASAGGRRVYGWLSEPKDLTKGPFPVRVRVPGAGIGATGPSISANEVVLQMNVHSYPQPEGKGPDADARRKAAYAKQDETFAKPVGVARYCQAGIHLGRETYFYYASILGINRAVNWLAERPECATRDFTYSGTSQGGGFGLILTALNRHITRSCIFVPAITDLLGFRQEGRQSGWPQIIEAQKPENRAEAEKWAPYFCGVNFARRITCPVRFVVGFADCTCSPNAVYSAFNVCPSNDKAIFDGIGMGHGVFWNFYTCLGAWERDPRAARCNAVSPLK